MFLEDRDIESVDSLVDFFHAELDNGSQQNIQNSFLKADSKLRCLDKEMLDIVSASDTQCIRSSILNSVKINGVSDADIENCCGGER